MSYYRDPNHRRMMSLKKLGSPSYVDNRDNTSTPEMRRHSSIASLGRSASVGSGSVCGPDGRRSLFLHGRGKVSSPETDLLIGISSMLRFSDIHSNTLRSLSNLDHPSLIGNMWNVGKVMSAETRSRISRSNLVVWADLDRRERRTRKRLSSTLGKYNVYPSFPESLVIGMLDNNSNLDLVYNGRGPVVIGGKIPDFISSNRSHNKIVEVFGRYWHDEYEDFILVDYYKDFGYDCLVL